MYMTQRRKLSDIFDAAIGAVNPYRAVAAHADFLLKTYRTGFYRKVYAVAFGKAALPMVKALEDSVPVPIDRSIVITRYGYTKGVRFPSTSLDVFEAGHPLPDERGVEATKKVMEILRQADEHALVACLISGGGSALLVSPWVGITLEEKRMLTDLLMKAGADINELNTVRKHISRVKGGRLAEIAYPAKVVSLILSDVTGDRLDVIASGPTLPDSTTYDDAWKILKKYDLINKSPRTVLGVLQKGREGLLPETPKEGNGIFAHVENLIVGSNRIAVLAAKKKASDLGLAGEVTSTEVAGEARQVGRRLAHDAMQRQEKLRASDTGTLCLISGGETTVTVRGPGLGGRNMELALSFAVEIEDIDGITLLSAGTDGTDGPTDAAGAIVDGQTIAMARSMGIDPEAYLENNDSYRFFERTGGLFITGPTGTNVMDIQLIVVEETT